MLVKSEREINLATKPSDLFTMNQNTIVEEKNQYLAQFKPAPYLNINNFIIRQKIIQLYQQALEELSMEGNPGREHEGEVIHFKSASGEEFEYRCESSTDLKLGTLYNSHENVIIIVEGKYKPFYDNYISKTKFYSNPGTKTWDAVQHMLPVVEKHFEDSKGRFVIILKKPYEMYSFRQVLDYYGGRMKPEYVASIMTKLYYFACYMDMCGMSHNGITIDNLFFAPGKYVEEGQECKISDMRIVGVFGGWFFTTYSDEKIKGLPAAVNEILPEESLRSGFSSYEVDELSIKRVARELLGDPSGKNLEDVPMAFVQWLNKKEIAQNPYLEFRSWNNVITDSFGQRRFVSMDVSI